MFEGLLQPTHLMVIFAVALFVFGPKKLPELGQGLGKGIRSFRESYLFPSHPSTFTPG